MNENYEKYIDIREEGDFILRYIIQAECYIIQRIIDDETNINRFKPIKKPNFSYYQSFSALNVLGKDDEEAKRIIKWSENAIGVIGDGSKTWDCELVILNKCIKKTFADLIFDAIMSASKKIGNVYMAVEKLESIFGLVYKIDKKFQAGIIGELLFMKKHEEYIEDLLEGYHKSELSKKNFESKTDFKIAGKNGVLKCIEVKTTFSEENTVNLKNSQIDKQINDYFIIMHLKKSLKDGKTMLDMINWFLTLKDLSSELRDEYEMIRTDFDDRDMIKFDINNIEEYCIEISRMPCIKDYDRRIKDISFSIDINSLDLTDANNIFEK